MNETRKKRKKKHKKSCTEQTPCRNLIEDKIKYRDKICVPFIHNKIKETTS